MSAPEDHLSLVWESDDGTWNHGTVRYMGDLRLTWVSRGHETLESAAAARKGFDGGFRVLQPAYNATECEVLDLGAVRLDQLQMQQGEGLFEWEDR